MAGERRGGGCGWRPPFRVAWWPYRALHPVVTIQVDGRHGGIRDLTITDVNRVRHVGERRHHHALLARGQVFDDVDDFVGQQSRACFDHRDGRGNPGAGLSGCDGSDAKAEIVQRRDRRDQLADQCRGIDICRVVQRQQDGVGAIAKTQLSLQASHRDVDGEDGALRRRERELTKRRIIEYPCDRDTNALAGGFATSLQTG